MSANSSLVYYIHLDEKTMKEGMNEQGVFPKLFLIAKKTWNMKQKMTWKINVQQKK